MQSEINQPDIHVLVEERNRQGLIDLLADWEPTTLAELIDSFEEYEDAAFVFNSLSLRVAVQTFEYLELGFQKYLLDTLPTNRIATLLNEMPADDRTGLLEELEPHTLALMISLLAPQERSIALKLLGYPEYSVGRLMTPDYIAVRAEWTVEEVLDYIRKYGHDSETLNVIYVIDVSGKLIDDIRVREILLADPSQQVSELMDYKYQALTVTDDQEGVASIFKRLNRVALPVTDPEGLLLGIVTIDDALEVVEEEDTEDIQKLGAVEALEMPYLDTPIVSMIRKRAVWLIVLFMGEMLTATAMGYFEGEIARFVVLTLFIPLIISSGGNTGSQAATLIIRAMALEEVNLRDWGRVMRREILSGLALGAMLGLIGFLRVIIWAQFTPEVYGQYATEVAFVVGFSLIGVVLWGTISGSMLPLLLKRLGLDPATSSAPFVATLVDVTGLVIYFTLAMLILHGALM